MGQYGAKRITNDKWRFCHSMIFCWLDSSFLKVAGLTLERKWHVLCMINQYLSWPHRMKFQNFKQMNHETYMDMSQSNIESKRLLVWPPESSLKKHPLMPNETKKTPNVLRKPLNRNSCLYQTGELMLGRIETSQTLFTTASRNNCVAWKSLEVLDSDGAGWSVGRLHPPHLKRLSLLDQWTSCI